MSNYRILIVDDEPLARERLKRLLQEHDDFVVAGEAANGDAALSWLRIHDADLVLLDIQMPGRTGLDVASEIATLPQPPLLVFCTAYDEHALQAFAVRAIDYLLKPIRKEDLSRALLRAGEWLGSRSITDVAATVGARTHLSARTHNGLQLIPLDDVFYFIADQKYVNVHHTEGDTLIDDSLKQLEDEFTELFVRVHRSALVARQRIERLEAQPEGGHKVFLRGMEEGVPVSRRHLADVKRVMRGL
ncbi:LytR/AlgR family response regulator transcription factor [Thalassolituus marinus]|uniref:Response regulator transcription factor n=1 Tax=Thalassolituus marinus TaxID=671053 RepID=A0ABS7ZLA0_9GAMM|nr:LytTR family DNA-binding domain-containing protein [Thalassolituus marinus]MCA6062501.1 response regulator transcription factor [Thalassolituus marinus]